MGDIHMEEEEMTLAGLLRAVQFITKLLWICG